MDGFDLGSSTI